MVSRKSRKIVYFIGIGGIGMSALARWFLSQKWAVLGSDATESEITRKLQKEGAEVKIGHKKANLMAKNSGLWLIIASQAVGSDNPEMEAARKLGVPVLTYPQAVGLLTGSYQTLAVAGAHGKSTTTALLGLIFQKAGLDPTVVVGTKLKEFGGKNFRSGKSDYLVLEADEYGRAFLNYSPTLAVVTNIDEEHLDTYKNLADVKKTFLQFLLQIQEGGALVLNRDNKNLCSLKNKIRQIAAKKKLKLIWYSLKSPAANEIKKIIKIIGRHNVSDALAALSAAEFFGVHRQTALRAIGEYRGAWRRMEYRGKFKIKNLKFKISVYDDYAHHPTEIKATLRAFREKFPKSKIICVFQPHQAKRLKLLFEEFTGAFRDADYLIFLPIYRVAGRDKIDKQFISEKLAKAVNIKNLKLGIKNSVFYLPRPVRLRQFLEKTIISLRRPAFSSHQSALVVMMGAGDIVNYTDSLIK